MVLAAPPLGTAALAVTTAPWRTAAKHLGATARVRDLRLQLSRLVSYPFFFFSFPLFPKLKVKPTRATPF